MKIVKCINCQRFADVDTDGTVVCRQCNYLYYDKSFDQSNGDNHQLMVQSLVRDKVIDLEAYKTWCGENKKTFCDLGALNSYVSDVLKM